MNRFIERRMIWAERTMLMSGIGACALLVSASLNAQTQPKIQKIATETAKRIVKMEVHHILTTPLEGCLGASQLCDELDTVLHKELEKAIPNVQFVRREEAVSRLGEYGFLSIDAYMGALDTVAIDAGAEAVIGENIYRKGRGKCELRARLPRQRLCSLA